MINFLGEILITGEILNLSYKMHGLFSFWHSNLLEQQMYPTLNGKTSIQKSLDDSDHPQTHIISPRMSDKGKLVGGVSFYSQPISLFIGDMQSFSA